MAKEIKYKVSLSVDGKEQLVTSAANIKELAAQLGAAQNRSDELRKAMIKFNNITTVFQNVASGLRQVMGVLREFSAANAAQVEVETKLATVMRQRMEASEADIDAIKQLASAQQELGVIGDEVQLAGAQQIATFLSQRSSLEALIPAMNDLLAQQKGLKATGEDAVTVANLMGKAMQGQASALRRVGITFTEAQEQVLKYGDESQRAAMLAEVITDNVGHMNSELAKTDVGRAKQLVNTLGDMQEQIGALLAPYEAMIVSVGQLGLAINAFVTMAGGIMGAAKALLIWTNTAKLASINTKIAGNMVRWFTTVMNVSSLSVTAGTVAVRGLTWALRALEAATVIGTIFAGLSMAMEWFGSSASETADELGNMAGKSNAAADSYKRVMDVFESTSAQTYGNLMTSYSKLQAAWKALNNEQQKIAWVKDNQKAFQELGLQIDGVADAENAFVKNTDAVVQSFLKRAKAAARLAQLTEEYKLQNELIDKISTADAAAQARHHVNAGDKAKVTSWNREKDGKYIELGRDGFYHYTQAGADRENRKVWQSNSPETRANRKALQESKERTARIEADLPNVLETTEITGKATNTVPTPKATTKPTKAAPAAEGSMDWYEQRLAELRKQLRAAADEETARALQADYKATEQEYADLKVSIGVEAPDKAETDTALDKLRDELRAAQREFDDAVTVEAKVEASAKADDIQARIDEATRGQLTIGADVEPSYIAKGSAADLRQSYQNAQARATRIQQDYEIGLIGKDKALADIAEINLELEKLGDNGMKPIEIGVMGEDADKAGESLKEATAAIGSMGQALSGLGGAIEMPELNIAGTVAQAVATMALGYAKATSEAGKASPWEWVAFAATGLAQLTAMIASVRQATAFATGGIVGGGSPSGDRKFVRVNSGEMILNKTQQARLFGLVSGSLRCLPSAEARPTVAMGDISGIVEPAVTNVNVSLGLDARKMVRVIHETKTVAGKSGRKYS